MNELQLDHLRYSGPGTDLTVGLLPGSRWISGAMDTIHGITFTANLPTEETFTAPDPTRVDGVVTATKPLLIPGAGPIEGLRVSFEGGRAVQIDADSGAEILRSMTEKDEGAARIGEVALVDRESRVGQSGSVFYSILLDENAASHLALGAAYPFSVEEGPDRERRNQSAIHVDFMIGSDQVDVTGVTGRRWRGAAVARGRLADLSFWPGGGPAEPSPTGFAPRFEPRRGTQTPVPATLIRILGEVPEWLNGHDWKSCNGETRSGVRIPLSPLRQLSLFRSATL